MKNLRNYFRITISIVIYFISANFLFAQWLPQGATTGNIYYNNGSVGLGTNTPLKDTNNSGLHISKGNHSSALFGNPIAESYGGIVQTSDKKHRIYIGANLYDDESTSWRNFQPGKGGAGISVLADRGGWGTSIDFYTSDLDNKLEERLSINGIGNVGIGTHNPFLNTSNLGLHINRGYHSSILLGDPIQNTFGGIIQTSDNKHRVYIGANLYDDELSSWKNFQPGKGGAGISIVADKGGWGTSIGFYTSAIDNAVEERMTINDAGNVGIGTRLIDNPNNYKLAVNGRIGAKEIIVETTSSTWADYVFEKTYQLRPLSEVESFITANKHLPEVPSAKEVESTGINVAQMDALLLKKIEELTLYLIEMKKENEVLKKEVQTLKDK